MKSSLYILTLFFIPLFVYCQEYSLNEEVKILYNKEMKPTKINDSAKYYRLITFKEKFIPKGRVKLFENNILKSESYASFIGLDLKGIDSVELNGPSKIYENGNLSIAVSYLNNKMEGDEIYYYESGEIKKRTDYIDGNAQGKEFWYYQSGEIMAERNYVDNILEGSFLRYNESGEIVEKSIYVNDKLSGEVIGLKDGVITYKANYKNDIVEGKQLFYYNSGKSSGEISYKEGKRIGKEISYYESGNIKIVRLYIKNQLNGKSISYYETGETETKTYYINDLRNGQFYKYYKSGELQSQVNYVDGLRQGIRTVYFKNSQIDYTELYKDDKRIDRKIALVIGNSAYEKGQLTNPVNDAILIAKSLEKLNFKVMLHKNLASRDEMLDAIKFFGRERYKYEIGFVYYAGHGVQLNNENYLLPVKEEFEFEEDIEDYGVSMQRVLSYLESSNENQLNFVVLDACRDNPFESNWNKTRSIKGNGLVKTSPPSGSLIAYSTDHGQTAADGDGANSIYSKVLSSMLLEENISIEQVFKKVRIKVLEQTNNTQSPVEESKLTGDVYYFNKTKVD